MAKFCICIPTVNQAESLQYAVNGYLTNFPDIQIFIHDNGNQTFNHRCMEDERVLISVSPENLGVAATWNLLAKWAFNLGHDLVWMLNDDIFVPVDSNTFKTRLDGYYSPFGFFNPAKAIPPVLACDYNFHWGSFILPKSVYFDHVGEFDEGFKLSFFEDNDYQYRIKLAGGAMIRDGFLNPELSTYRNSASTIANPKLNNFMANRERYMAKWGGMPGEETYLTPFNLSK